VDSITVNSIFTDNFFLKTYYFQANDHRSEIWGIPYDKRVLLLVALLLVLLLLYVVIVPWFRLLVIRFSLRNTWFNCRTVHMEFAVDRLIIGEVIFSESFSFSQQNIIISVFHAYISGTTKYVYFRSTVSMISVSS
jgi:hypothetical protein